MDIDALLRSIGAGESGSSQDNIVSEIEGMVLKRAADAGGASQATGAVLQCMGAAALPLINSMFIRDNDRKASAQDRLLFSLVLAGATIALEQNDEAISMEVTISPGTVTEALKTYTKLTGKDISPFLPPSMVAFAKGEPQRQH